MEEQIKKMNPIKKWFVNLKNTKKNYQKVKSSPYASLTLALKVRKIIVSFLVLWILYLGYGMVATYRSGGITGLLGRLFTAGMIIFICWKIYSTIPAAKRQVEHYKKYPHLINYCPTDTKQEVDEILLRIKLNKEKEEKQNVWKEESRSSGKTSSSKSTSTNSNAS